MLQIEAADDDDPSADDPSVDAMDVALTAPAAPTAPTASIVPSSNNATCDYA
jgi:hypothetical protein